MRADHMPPSHDPPLSLPTLQLAALVQKSVLAYSPVAGGHLLLWGLRPRAAGASAAAVQPVVAAPSVLGSAALSALAL